MEESILVSVKKLLGIEESYTAYDLDILMHINSVLATLNQLGIGPVNGYMIEDAVPTWGDFIGGDNRLNAVKTYVVLRVRLLFDPPTTSFAITAMEEQIREFEWRLNVVFEEDGWTDPDPPLVPDEEEPGVIDGGSP